MKREDKILREIEKLQKELRKILLKKYCKKIKLNQKQTEELWGNQTPSPNRGKDN